MLDETDINQIMVEIADLDQPSTFEDLQRGRFLSKEITRRIKAGEYLRKDQLEHGKYYSGKCRNSCIARWNAETQRFVYWRTKFGYLFAEDICHPVDEDRFDVFYPFSITKPCLYVIPLEPTPVELRMT
jgi:hypothetical protein